MAGPLRVLRLPLEFNFVEHGIFSFDKALAFFDWSIPPGDPVEIDLRPCHVANFTALSLLILYAWHLEALGSEVTVIHTGAREGASDACAAWEKLGAAAFSQILTRPTENFRASNTKPLLALRTPEDSSRAIQKTADFTRQFNIDYKQLLTYVISEITTNTLEHGTRFFVSGGRTFRLPSLIQFSWYQRRNELQFLVADLGVGIKQHLEQAYPRFASHAAALSWAIKPQVSGTFGPSTGYTSSNNAGMGLYISSTILRRLRGDMHMVSGNGLLHVSPTDITATTLRYSWPGTLVHVNVQLGVDPAVRFQRFMTEIKEAARSEVLVRDKTQEEESFTISMFNYFGTYAENKSAAISYRNTHLLPAIAAGKKVVFDFADVALAPHSFLNALLADLVRHLGMEAYRRMRFLNTPTEIRETIDYILSDNTRGEKTASPS